jgi:hypothetical protein
VSGFFQSEIDEIKEILNLIKNFIKSNNKSIQITEYYITLGTKTLLEVVEDTLNDPNVDEEQKKEHAELMKTFLQKLKNLYSTILSSDTSEALKMKERIKDSARVLGFSGNNDNDIFSELENTVNRLDKREILL